MTKRKLPYTWIALGYAVLILIVSSIPDLTPPELGFKLQDKLYHLLEYSIFSLLLFYAFFNADRELLRKNVLIISLVVGTTFAILDEIHQGMIPGRSADITDFLADFLGLVLVQLILWFYFRKRSIAK